MKPVIQPFIFSWKGQFENACRIEDNLRALCEGVTVINSDDEHSRPGWIDIGDACFFSDQFRKALELFNGDILLHVQADVRYEKWQELIEDARGVFASLKAGIYAPHADYTWWTSERTDISSRSLYPPNLRLVACTDELVWFIRREVLDGLREHNVDLSRNSLGWGWDCILSAISYLKGYPVIRDYKHTVLHPRGTSYNSGKALEELNEVVTALPPALAAIYHLMRNDREKLPAYIAPQR